MQTFFIARTFFDRKKKIKKIYTTYVYMTTKKVDKKDIRQNYWNVFKQAK